MILYDSGFSLGAFHILLLFLLPFGVAVRGKAINIDCIGHSVLGER